MLSKSQARLFFLVSTFGFSGVFLALTVDTLRQVPARSNQDQMTESVVRGKDVWDHNNCMGCHTLLGEGAYYAPELTKVVDRRGEQWIRVFLKDPEAMFPGERRMVKYDFDEQQTTDLIAFLAWVGKIDTNGFPAEPDLMQKAPVTEATEAIASSAAQAPQIFDTVCIACHSLGGKGGAVGPALDGVGHRYEPDALRAWLQDPQKVKPGTAMPNLGLGSEDLDALTLFLTSQK